MYTHRHTSEFNVKEVSGAQVLQKDSMSGGSLKVERDVSAGFSSEGREVEVGGRAGEGCCVPVVPFRKQEHDMDKILMLLWWYEISHSLWVVRSRRCGDFDLPQLIEFAQFSLNCVQISFFECSMFLTEIFGLQGNTVNLQMTAIYNNFHIFSLNWYIFCLLICQIQDKYNHNLPEPQGFIIWFLIYCVWKKPRNQKSFT